MSRFLMDRRIFENPLWQDPIAFRLFFYLLGNAMFRDGKKIGKAELKRGQYLRSYRNLQRDLAYVEDGGEKMYSTKTIQRCVNTLVKDGRIQIEESSLGTIFTIVNYDDYQTFDNGKHLEVTEPQGNTEENEQIGYSRETPITTPRDTAGKQIGNSKETIRTNANHANQEKYPPTPQGGNHGFQKFWDVYPKKKAKSKSEAIWKRKKLDLKADRIIGAVERYRQSPEWLKDDGQFIPYPTTFLNQERWEDEITAVAQLQIQPQTAAAKHIDRLMAVKRIRNVWERDKIIETSRLRRDSLDNLWLGDEFIDKDSHEPMEEDHES